ncbi:uncharacterized protein LAESUDRAFT_792025 [Laetiporus sulphureus 93-53]|uniref:Uncharacterized protein n=1 Tax=Laetiporus sulphureus 93-53 TaxID=1314785 RepID=A0A165CBS9_9APHY|nr:uncharacterized protein LAESUDRAFT_792025 [Laetiporus sulphureus 93-53]KZT02526.1 hypothetical protein LAESUDRAFT_792025 [Laetiporus sulphureus 93-53]
MTTAIQKAIKKCSPEILALPHSNSSLDPAPEQLAPQPHSTCLVLATGFAVCHLPVPVHCYLAHFPFAEPVTSAVDAPPVIKLLLLELSPHLPLLSVIVVSLPPPVVKESTPWVTFTSPGEELAIEGHESLCASFLSHLQLSEMTPLCALELVHKIHRLLIHLKETFKLCNSDSDIDSCMASYIQALGPVLDSFATVDWLPQGILFLSPLHVQELLLECSQVQCHRLVSGMDTMSRSHDIPKGRALPVTWDTLDFLSSASDTVPPEAPASVQTSPSITHAVKAEPVLLPGSAEAKPEVFVFLMGLAPKPKASFMFAHLPLPLLPSSSVTSHDQEISSETEAALVLVMPKAHSPPYHTTKSAAIKRLHVESSEGESEPDVSSDMEMVEAAPVVTAVAVASSAKDPSANPPFFIQNPAHLPMYLLAWHAPMHAILAVQFFSQLGTLSLSMLLDKLLPWIHKAMRELQNADTASFSHKSMCSSFKPHLVATSSAPTAGPSMVLAAAATPLPLPADAESLATFIKAFQEQDHEKCWACKEVCKAHKEQKLH